MTRIWKEDGFVADDPWVFASNDNRDDTNARRILDFSSFVEGSRALGRAVAEGVSVSPGDDVSELAPYLEELLLVSLEFPAFSDGRAYSHASLLRDRYGFTGEVRATGDVLIDQIPLMQRCGVDGFAVSNATALKRLEENRLPSIDRHYQPAARAAEPGARYSWRRQAHSD